MAAAATEAVGGGTAVQVETSDDPGEAYDVEVRMDDGREVDVALDEKLTVVGRDVDDRDDVISESGSGDDRDGGRDADDRVVGASERASAERAALDAVGGGTVMQVQVGDDRGEAYEVEVRDSGNTTWDIELDSDYQVLSKIADN